ncbi:MAG: efflux RND transporter periplasmic adaptor subunit [Caldimonas sp.]
MTKTPDRSVLAAYGIVAAIAVAVAASLATLALQARAQQAAAAKPAASSARPALTVTVARPERSSLPLRIAAHGNIAAWQEAVIGTEANGLRLADVKVNVGDVVRRGQTLASFAPEMMDIDLAQQRAAVAEAEATLAEATANAERAKSLQATGALSDATIQQYVTAERTARARLEAQRAATRARQLRLSQTAVLAPDDGVISARSATVGAVLPAGQELFRMIRKGRLEWRAEVASADLGTIQPGMKAIVVPPSGAPLTGTVRTVAPTVDDKTRNGIVYVDLPAGADGQGGRGSARAGMFARGEFDVGQSSALTLPQGAVLLRDGFSYVMQVGADSKVAERKVQTGRRVGDRVEIQSGLAADARVVAQGGSFLADGDVVRVVDAPPKVATAAASGP